MPNASVNIGGDASGAVAAVAAAQGAIDGLTGKTVVANVEVRGGEALGAATKNMRDMASAAGRVNKAAQQMGDHFERAGRGMSGMAGGFARAGAGAERAGRATRGFSDEVARAGERIATAAGHAERIRGSLEAIGSGTQMRALSAGASASARSMRELESSTGGAMRAITTGQRSIGGGSSAVRGAAIELRQMRDGAYGVAEGMKAITTGQKAIAAGRDRFGRSPEEAARADRTGSGRFAGGAGSGMRELEMGGLGDFTGRARASSFRAGSVPPRGSSQQYDVGSRIGDIEDEQAARSGSRRTSAGSRAASSREAARGAREEASGIDEVGRASGRASGSTRQFNNTITGFGGGMHHLERAIRPVQEAGFQLAMIGGAMAGVAGESTKLMDATTGMGLNFKGMAAGIQLAEQSAARSHNLGLNGLDQELRQSARAMTNELAPAMRAGVGATKAWEEAKMGAQASLGPSIEGFANQMTQSAPAMQSIMSNLGKAALGLGTDVVSGVAQAAPAFAALQQTVAGNTPEITAGAKAVTDLGVGLADMAVKGIAGFGQIDSAVKSVIQPGGEPGIRKLFGGGSSSGGQRVASGAFDPSRPFSGTLPDGTPGTGDVSPAAAGHPSLNAPRNFQDMAKAGGGALSPGYHPSSDADWAKGMSPKQIYESQFRAANGGHPSTGPYPSGLPGQDSTPLPPVPASSSGMYAQTPAHFGSGVRPMPASIAPSLGAGSLAPLNDMMSAASNQIAGGGADTGQAVVKHVQKAVQTAAPAASAGGAAIGGAVNSGMAQGMNSSQTVVDTVTIKHTKHVIDLASAIMGVRSPSTEFDYLGRMAMAGFGQGIERGAGGSFGSLGSVLDTHQAMTAQATSAKMGAGGFGYDNTDTRATTVSMRRPDSKDDDQAAKPPQAMQYSSPLANANIDRHNRTAQDLARGREQSQRTAIGGMTHDERAAKLAQNRADLHEKALARLGVAGHSDPFQNRNSALNNTNPFKGTPGDPIAAAARTAGLNAVANPFHSSALQSAFAQHGQAMTAGVGVGIAKGTPAAKNQMSTFSRGMQNQHKKDHGISSPSTVFAQDGAFMAAGVGVGFTAGTSGAVSAISDAAGQMSNAIAGPLNNRGLMLGYSFANSITTGAVTTLKTANFQASGTQNIAQLAGEQAQAALGRAGLLGPGAGTSIYKTPTVSDFGSGIAAQLNAAVAAAAQATPTQITVMLDSSILDQKIVNGQNGLIELIHDAITAANG